MPLFSHDKQQIMQWLINYAGLNDHYSLNIAINNSTLFLLPVNMALLKYLEN